MKIKMYQQGGPMTDPAQAGAAAPVQGGAEDQLAQLAEQLVQMLMENLQDPNAVMAVLQMAMEMLQGASQSAGQPVFKKGGKLVKKAQKACGGKMK